MRARAFLALLGTVRRLRNRCTAADQQQNCCRIKKTGLLGELLLGFPPSWTRAIVLDAFCSACENESRETSVSLPGVKRRQRVAVDCDRIRRSFFNRLLPARIRLTSKRRPSALHNRNSSFVIDSEAVMLGVIRVVTMTIVQFYAFDMLVSDGEDLRRLPLSMRKTDVSRLLARRKPGLRGLETCRRQQQNCTDCHKEDPGPVRFEPQESHAAPRRLQCIASRAAKRSPPNRSACHV